MCKSQCRNNKKYDKAKQHDCSKVKNSTIMDTSDSEVDKIPGKEFKK
jgi:hypothetical protein